eukprot:jgi/Mesen1/7573/ME000392S06839
MELIHTILDLTLIPSGIISLFFITPLVFFLRQAYWALRLLFPEDVRGKVVVITGASSGIGEHMAYEYAKKGARLVLAARREEQLRKVANRASQLGSPDAFVVVADVSNEQDCKKIIDDTINRFGRLDHLVNNAGIAHSFEIEDAASQEASHDYVSVMDITFWGQVFPTYYALPHLKRARGRIVVVASIAAFIPFPRMAIYNSAKAATFNFYDTLRVEVGNQVGITIAAPGWIESEMTAGKFMDARGEMILDAEQRDKHVGPVPVESVTACAKTIVNGALHDTRYVFVPFWYSVFIFWRVFAPDVLEAFFRLGFFGPPGQTPPTKKILDTAKMERALYPQSIQKQQ